MAAKRGLPVAILCLATTASAQFPPSGFEIGRPFPAFRFLDASSGLPASIQDYRGTKTLVAVFASW